MANHNVSALTPVPGSRYLFSASVTGTVASGDTVTMSLATLPAKFQREIARYMAENTSQTAVRPFTGVTFLDATTCAVCIAAGAITAPAGVMNAAGTAIVWTTTAGPVSNPKFGFQFCYSAIR